jgi:23S rRNA pseudouridine1911/1915/1917 synthase
LVLI